MLVEINELVGKECVITPFNTPGRIVAMTQSRKGTEFQVVYFMNGEHRVEWFYDYFIEILKDIKDAIKR